MIYVVQIEPLRERYSSWWEDYIPARIRGHSPCTTISAETLTDSVETGTVLDAGSTSFYKAGQLKEIASLFYQRKIKPGDHFLICDIWFPGIEMIRYMSQLYEIPVSIWGVWHAGSSTRNDFAEPMHGWSRHFEIGFLNMCNGIFVGSDYSKNSIVERLLYSLSDEEAQSIAERIYCYGMPLDFDSLQKYKSEERTKILFPHRPDEEKNPHIFFNIINGLSTFWEDFDRYTFTFCTSKKEYKSQSQWINAAMGDLLRKTSNIEVREDLSKEEYYALLSESVVMVSTTSEENFGYCAVEALACGTPVLLPKAFSHTEIVENMPQLLYDDYDELLMKIPEIIENPVHKKELKALAEPYKYTIDQWLKIMGVI